MDACEKSTFGVGGNALHFGFIESKALEGTIYGNAGFSRLLYQTTQRYAQPMHYPCNCYECKELSSVANLFPNPNWKATERYCVRAWQTSISKQLRGQKTLLNAKKRLQATLSNVSEAIRPRNDSYEQRFIRFSL